MKQRENMHRENAVYRRLRVCLASEQELKIGCISTSNKTQADHFRRTSSEKSPARDITRRAPESLNATARQSLSTTEGGPITSLGLRLA